MPTYKVRSSVGITPRRGRNRLLGIKLTKEKEGILSLKYVKSIGVLITDVGTDYNKMAAIIKKIIKACLPLCTDPDMARDCYKRSLGSMLR